MFNIVYEDFRLMFMVKKAAIFSAEYFGMYI